MLTFAGCVREEGETPGNLPALCRLSAEAISASATRRPTSSGGRITAGDAFSRGCGLRQRKVVFISSLTSPVCRCPFIATERRAGSGGVMGVGGEGVLWLSGCLTWRASCCDHMLVQVDQVSRQLYQSGGGICDWIQRTFQTEESEGTMAAIICRQVRSPGSPSGDSTRTSFTLAPFPSFLPPLPQEVSAGNTGTSVGVWYAATRVSARLKRWPGGWSQSRRNCAWAPSSNNTGC